MLEAYPDTPSIVPITGQLGPGLHAIVTLPLSMSRMRLFMCNLYIPDSILRWVFKPGICQVTNFSSEWWWRGPVELPGRLPGSCPAAGKRLSPCALCRCLVPSACLWPGDDVCVGRSLLLWLLEGREHFSCLKSPLGIRAAAVQDVCTVAAVGSGRYCCSSGTAAGARGTAAAALFTQLLSRILFFFLF